MNTNPLRQYFRRPAVYLKLPSGGKGYPPNTLTMPDNGELPVFPMTAIDEITSKTPDALFNGVAVVEIIKSCVPDIKDPWVVQGNDLDALLIAIKAASGDELTIGSMCPNCQNQADFGLNLPGILSTLKAGDYASELSINDLKIKFRPLTYKEMNEAALAQFEINKASIVAQSDLPEEEKQKILEDALRKITEQTMQILSQTIEYIKTPNSLVENKDYILDFIRNCDKNVYVTLRDYSAKLRSESELKPLEITCQNCNHQYTQPYTLNIADFFG
jgi:hypothetical protein